MVDVIGARCPSCQAIVRVARSLGGKHVKCPHCAAVVTIPTPWNSPMDAIPDAALPEVAVGEAAPPPPQPAPQPSTSSTRRLPRQRATSPVRRSSTGTSRPRLPPVAAPSRVPWIIAAVIICATVVATIAVLATRRRSETPTYAPPSRVAGPADAAAPRESEQQVRERVRQFVDAYNSCDAKRIATFYKSSKRAEAVSTFEDIYVNRWLKYENVSVGRIEAGRETAVVQLKLDRIAFDRNRKEGDSGYRQEEKDQERLMNWAKIDGEWLLTDAPAR